MYGHAAMCNKSKAAIISPIERITHEFSVSFVIITWYIGTVIGSLVAIHLHTINRSRSELVLLATGISFIICLLVETHLSIDSSLYDYFLLRMILAVLIGIIYSSSVIGRLQINLTAFTYGFTLATIISISQTRISFELCCVSLILVYSLIALNLSTAGYLFDDPKILRINRKIVALNSVVKQTRLLIYLTGAQLLTVFVYFAPFLCRASQIIIRPNIVPADVNNDEIFNDLVVLLLTRLALGIITILFVRHNVNYLTIIYLVPLTTLHAVVLLIPMLDLNCLVGQRSFMFCAMMTMYISLSLLADVLGHRAVLNINAFVCADFGLSVSDTVISITFANFIEHLIDVSFVVVYLNDWIGGKLILTSLAIISLTIILHRRAQTSFEQVEDENKTKQQIL